MDSCLSFLHNDIQSLKRSLENFQNHLLHELNFKFSVIGFPETGMAVKDFVVDNDIDILAMTETWLRPGTDDSVEIGISCPTGYRVIHIPRSHSAGCGVGIIF